MELLYATAYATPSDPITAYGFEVITPNTTSTAVSGSGANGYIKIDNLRGDIAYQFRVRAMNSYGWGVWSAYSSPLFVLGCA